ncbi:tetratricopeptide repeat protein [Actinokineospora soli]|uniref:Tetratricopeptide repeat protein n=1 Tax=Actinokineospora soli TaxID=1048753 RepID=A0ABW2TPZ6_9PSEU
MAALLARAAAASGEHDEARRALDAAHRQIDLVTEPGSGMDFFDAARLRGIAGSSFLAMRDTARAAPILRDALDRRAACDSKGRPLLTLDLAECLVHDGEVEEASRVAVRALDLAAGSMVEPITARARAIRAQIRRRAGSMGAGDLEARLREHGGG